ncbi:MAG: POTRA domain-containing protein [Crocinitomicaceae bacterium]
MLQKGYFIFILIFFLSHFNFGQQKIELEITNIKTLKPKPSFKFYHKDSLSAIKYLNSINKYYFDNGYLLCRFQILENVNNKWSVNIEPFEKFQWARLENGNLDDEMIRLTRFREKLYNQADFSLSEYQEFTSKLLEDMENKGYPFSKVWLDSITIGNQQISGKLMIDKGPFVEITKIHVKGSKKISPKFISTYLRLKEGNPYSEKTLSQISNRLKEISFVKELRPHEILFTPEGAEVFIYVETIKNSNFNGIIGIQPDDQTGKVNITGELQLRLKNLLKHGEMLHIHWRKLQPKTQDLKIEINWPFLFKTPFGLDGGFYLYKRDTSYLNLHAKVGVQYYLKGGNYLKAFYEFFSTDILSTSLINVPSDLTQLADARTNSYGMSYFNRSIDYIFNPRKGIIVDLEGAVGLKKIRKNPAFDDSLYSSVNLKSTNYRLSASIEGYIPLAKRHVIKLSNITKTVLGNQILENEMFRFGGLNSLKGFGEESFLATFYSIVNFEYRFLLDRNSNVFAFFNAAYYEKNLENSYFNDWPYGFGVGINFATKFGTFSLVYALGTQQNQPILFRNSKVHFGYIAYF